MNEFKYIMLDMKEEMQYRKITNTKTAQNPK
jgi:hypothetical protein